MEYNIICETHPSQVICKDNTLTVINLIKNLFGFESDLFRLTTLQRSLQQG